MPPRRGGRGRGRGFAQKRNTQPRSDFIGVKQEQTDSTAEVKGSEDFKCDAINDVQNGTSGAGFEPIKPEALDKKEGIEHVEESVIKNENENININKNEEVTTEKPEQLEKIEDEEKLEKADEIKNKSGSIDLPFKVKVSHLPATYILPEFQWYLKNTFNIEVTKIISPAENSPWLLLPFATKEEQENCIKLLHNHIWKKKALRAIAFYSMSSRKHSLEDGDDPESKKSKLEEVPVLTLEEEILSESLPLFNVPYEEQNRLTILDVQLLSNKLHAFMCVRNPALAGWAEAMTEKNNGSIFKIEPLKPTTFLKGYRNKCKFRIGDLFFCLGFFGGMENCPKCSKEFLEKGNQIGRIVTNPGQFDKVSHPVGWMVGKNTEGETTVGFCLNDNENKILGVQPGDKLIHLPDSMKYAAKKFEEFIRASGKEPYDKKVRSGFWHHIIIRIAPEGSLMLVIVAYHNNMTDDKIAEVKNQVKEYFLNGGGKECNVYSLYFQIMNNKAPMLPPEKLELLHGKSYFYENICGLKFYAGPFSILNVNSSSSENIYNSIAELAEPTKETTILDLCSGTGGISFTIADKCKNVIAIESQEDHIRDALKTMEMNNIENVEFIKGKVEDVLGGVFEMVGDAPVIPIIDPPRQGLVQKAISQLRAKESIKKLVYVCSNSKMGAKNFLDLCASADKKEGTFGNPLNVVFAGLPFLPVRAIPVDVAPYTVNNSIIILFERIDPSTFPPAKNPPPQPLKRPQVKKDDKKRKRNQGKRMRGLISPRGRKFRNPGPAMRGNFKGQNFKRNIIQPRGGFIQHRFPQPLMKPLEPALSLVAKYERRIAELEQQDRAFKAGLTMGLQALGTRGGPSGGSSNLENFGNSLNSNLGNNFGNFRNQIIGDNPAWQRGGGRNFENPGMSFGGGNNFGGGIMGGGGFNNFNNGGGFGNFGGGIFNPVFRGGVAGRGKGYRNLQGNKHRR